MGNRAAIDVAWRTVCLAELELEHVYVALDGLGKAQEGIAKRLAG